MVHMQIFNAKVGKIFAKNKINTQNFAQDF